MFAKVENGVLTIKNRDIERHFQNGRVWGECRKCGTVIEWRDEIDEARTR